MERRGRAMEGDGGCLDGSIIDGDLKVLHRVCWLHSVGSVIILLWALASSFDRMYSDYSEG